MNGFLLDTNVPSESIRLQPDANVQVWLAAQRLDQLWISAVSFGEFRKGIELRVQDKRRTELELWLEKDLTTLFAGRILPLTRSIAEHWGVLEAQRQKMGRPLHVPDGQIAATALEHDLTLVTRNTKDFAQLGLTLIDPWEPQP
jgi:tRNA(fMet)-specific endonuclease VapC